MKQTKTYSFINGKMIHDGWFVKCNNGIEWRPKYGAVLTAISK